LLAYLLRNPAILQFEDPVIDEADNKRVEDDGGKMILSVITSALPTDKKRNVFLLRNSLMGISIPEGKGRYLYGSRIFVNII
jgi:hypothetical protein